MGLRRRRYGLAAVCVIFLSPNASAADFNDFDYHEVVLFEWDESTIDVLIVPPVSPLVLWRVEAIRQSVQAWEDGMNAIGGWLSGKVEINVYALSDATPPPAEALADPEIVVAFSTEPGVLGIGIPWDFMVCQELPPLLGGSQSPLELAARFGHGHDGSPYRFQIAKRRPRTSASSSTRTG